jgi:hypothetical protein
MLFFPRFVLVVLIPLHSGILVLRPIFEQLKGTNLSQTHTFRTETEHKLRPETLTTEISHYIKLLAAGSGRLEIAKVAHI